MKKVLVFGGSGFLGGYVIEELLSRRYDVISADLVPSKYYPEKHYVYCDIRNLERVKKIFDLKFDIVYNFAGFANLDLAVDDPLNTINLNIVGNLNILEATRLAKINRFIFASSAYAMNDKGSFYGISKLTSEKIVEEYYKKYELQYTIVRYGSVYSERSYDNNYIYQIVKEAVLNKKIEHNGDGEEVREYIHAADAARLSVDILENEEYINQNVILTGFERMKRKELFYMIKEILNENVEIIFKHDVYANHYKLSPYSFHPTMSKKLISNPFIDMGQGILECIKEIHSESDI